MIGVDSLALTLGAAFFYFFYDCLFFSAFDGVDVAAELAYVTYFTKALTSSFSGFVVVADAVVFSCLDTRASVGAVGMVLTVLL